MSDEYAPHYDSAGSTDSPPGPGRDLIGGRQGAVIALVFAGAMNFFSYWYSDRIVLAMVRGKEVGPE